MPATKTATKEATARDVLRIMWQSVRHYKGLAILILLCGIAAAVLDAFRPWVLKQLFDLLETNTPSATAIDIFFPTILLYAGLQVGGWMLWRIIGYADAYFQTGVMIDLEKRAFNYLLGHSYQFFADSFAGAIVKKVGRLSRAFESLADEIVLRFIRTGIFLTASVIGLYFQYPLLAWIFFVWTCVFIASQYFVAKWTSAAKSEEAKLDSEVGSVLSDVVSNAVTVKLFPAFTYETGRFAEVNARYGKARTKSWLRLETVVAMQAFLMVFIEIGLMYAGVLYWQRGVLTLGDVVFIQTTILMVFSRLWDFGNTFRHVANSFANGKEMVEIMMLPHGITDAKNARGLQVKKGEIKFQNVDFSFGKNKVLKDFSVDIKPNEKVALVGPSGAGKTTITQLLFRFYDLQSGKILIDGQDIAKATQDSLRDAISLVPQEPVLFHRTLMDNIRYGRRDATDDEVIEAAKKAHCHEFITALPFGYDTFVGERGIKLSGGERQRVAIARAILKNAPILVLDEATSALDSESESLIQDALRALMHDKTVIVIAHRLSTIMQMDRILVIEQGKIAADGSHAELLAKQGTYQKLWNIQAGGFTSE